MFSPRDLKRHRYTFLIFVVLVAGGAIFFLQKLVLTRTVEVVLPFLAPPGWEVHWDHLEAGLFIPLTVEGIRVRGKLPGNSVGGDETNFTISKAVLEFSNVLNWWKGRDRFFSQLQVEGLEGVFDFRSRSSSFSKKFWSTVFKEKIRYQKMMLPVVLEIQAPNLDLLFDGVTYRLRNILANLSEDSLGVIQYSFAKIETPAFKKNLPAASTVATWKSGILSLIRWPVLPGCSIELMNINFLNPEGLGLDFDIAAFGGGVKGSLTLKINEIKPYWNAAFVAQRMELGSLAKTLEIEAPVSGILKEGKLTFRGKPGNLSDAEASIHVSAEGFHWNELGWQHLEFGVDLINQRIAIPEFHLRQKENSLYFNGSFSIPKSLRDFSKTPFEISVVGDIQDLAALAGLLGPKFQHLHGRMTLDGSLWSGKEGPNGYFKFEASSIQFQEAQFTSARINTVFRNGNAEVTFFELWNGEDFLSAKGTVDLNHAAHQYSGVMSIKAREIGAYQSLWGENWQQKFPSGTIGLNWQGDGTFHRHSGAFAVQMENLVSEWTPRGVSGNVEGTFSPGYVSFNRFELFRDTLRLTTQMALSPFGVKVNDFRINKGAKQLAQASAFLPVDMFAFARGASWKDALNSDKAVFLDLNSEKMELADLYHLSGQNLSWTGAIQLRLLMEGPPSSLHFNGHLLGDGLRGKWNGQEIAPSKVQMKMEAVQGTATLLASFVSPKIGEIGGNLHLPLNVDKTFANILNFSRPFQGDLQIEKFDMSMLKVFFPGMNKLAGEGRANLTFKNTLSDPQVDGQVAFSDGILEVVSKTSVISDLQMNATVINNRVSLDVLQGKLGAGTFTIKGGADFSKVNKPRLDLQLMGDKLLLYQDPSLTVQANVHLFAQGTLDDGKISGAIRLQNSELRRYLEMVSSNSKALSVESIGLLNKKNPSLLDTWGLDISISNANDGYFLVKAKLTDGEIIPNLHLGGSLGNILPSGSIEFKNLQAFFPFTIAKIPSGRILFDPKYPREPLLDVQGFADVAGATLQIRAAGSLVQPSFFFASDPPLSQHYISLLLLTGLSPWPENMKIESSLSQPFFPSQTSRIFGQKQPTHFLGRNFEVETPENFSLMSPFYGFSGIPYVFKLAY